VVSWAPPPRSADDLSGPGRHCAPRRVPAEEKRDRAARQHRPEQASIPRLEGGRARRELVQAEQEVRLREQEVTDALERVTDAQEQVGRAQERLGEAQERLGAAGEQADEAD
jgi:hypothetical protein